MGIFYETITYARSGLFEYTVYTFSSLKNQVNILLLKNIQYNNKYNKKYNNTDK